jgi:cytochrome c553
MHQNMVAAADSLSDDEIRTISQFLKRMIFAVESAHDHSPVEAATDAEAEVEPEAGIIPAATQPAAATA